MKQDLPTATIASPPPQQQQYHLHAVSQTGPDDGGRVVLIMVLFLWTHLESFLHLHFVSFCQGEVFSPLAAKSYHDSKSSTHTSIQ